MTRGPYDMSPGRIMPFVYTYTPNVNTALYTAITQTSYPKQYLVVHFFCWFIKDKPLGQSVSAD